MTKITLSDVSNLLGNPTSAANTINANNALIEGEFENTLSRDGSTPNQMLADIDMNGQDLLNVGLLEAQSLSIDGEIVSGLGNLMLRSNNLSDLESILQAKINLGLNNVDNTSDSNKPISSSTAAAIAVVQEDINSHEVRTDNPHSVTAAQLGLGNVDNTSDTNKPISSATQAALNLKEDKVNKGVVNGYASLGPDGLVPSTQLPVSGSYKGTWNASTNTPTITSGIGVNGDFYLVNVAGTTNIDGVASWAVGDQIRFNGTVWQKIPNNADVSSVNGFTGAVVLAATNIGSSATGNVVATDVQAAIAELDGQDTTLQANIDTKASSADLTSGLATKVTKTGDTMTGDLTINSASPEIIHHRTVDTARNVAIARRADATNAWLWGQLGSGDSPANGWAVLRRDATGGPAGIPLTIDPSNGAVILGEAAGFTRILGGLEYTKGIALSAATDANTLTSAGIYDGTSMTNMPYTSGGRWRVLVDASSQSTNDVEQIASRIAVAAGTAPEGMGYWQRRRQGGTWTDWTPLGGWVTPEHYAAVGDGVTDDSTPLSLALKSGFPVLLRGYYRTTTAITCGVGVNTRGDGTNIIQGMGKRHILVDHAGNGIAYTGSFGDTYDSPQLIIKDVVLICDNASSTGAAVNFTAGTGGSGSVSKTFHIENVHAYGDDDATKAFAFGVVVTNGRNGTVRDCVIQGKRGGTAGSRTGTGILLQGDSDPVDGVIEGNHIYFMQHAISILGTCEGMTIDKNTIVACDRGVRAELDENPISGDNAGKPLLKITNNHMNCNAYGVYMARVRDYNITQNDFLVETAGANWNGVRNDQDSSASEYGWIDGNKFEDANGLGAGTTIGVNLEGFTSGVLNSRIGLNRFVSLDIGINLGANAKNVRWEDASVFANVTTSVSNSGGGTNTAY